MSRPRRWRRWLWLAALPLLSLALLHWLLQPERLGAALLRQLQDASGLRIEAGTPARLGYWPGLRLDIDQLQVLRSDGSALLRADRIALVLPISVLWSQPRIEAVELDGTTLDLTLLLDELRKRRDQEAPRPASLPTLGSLRIRSGSLLAQDWQLQVNLLELDGLRPGQPLSLSLQAGLHRPQQKPLRFRLQLAGQVQADDGDLRAESLQLQLGSSRDKPILQAQGQFAWSASERFELHLQGQLLDWPQAWPTPPLPRLRESAPAQFSLDHAGPADLSGEWTLDWRSPSEQLQLGMRWPELQRWLQAADWSQAPPLQLRYQSQELQLGNIRLQDVQVEHEQADDAE